MITFKGKSRSKNFLTISTLWVETNLSIIFFYFELVFYVFLAAKMKLETYE